MEVFARAWNYVTIDINFYRKNRGYGLGSQSLADMTELFPSFAELNPHYEVESENRFLVLRNEKLDVSELDRIECGDAKPIDHFPYPRFYYGKIYKEFDYKKVYFTDEMQKWINERR